MIPADALEKTRLVNIYFNWCIRGFFFFDKDGVLLWKIGLITASWSKETVVLAENEVIVGVVANLNPEDR